MKLDYRGPPTGTNILSGVHVFRSLGWRHLSISAGTQWALEYMQQFIKVPDKGCLRCFWERIEYELNSISCLSQCYFIWSDLFWRNDEYVCLSIHLKYFSELFLFPVNPTVQYPIFSYSGLFTFFFFLIFMNRVLSLRTGKWTVVEFRLAGD